MEQMECLSGHPPSFVKKFSCSLKSVSLLDMQNISHGYMKHAIRLVIIAYHLQNLFVAPTSPAPTFMYLFLHVCVDSQPDEESNNFVLKVI